MAVRGASVGRSRRAMMTRPGTSTPWTVWTSPLDGSVNIVNRQGEYVALVGREVVGADDTESIRSDAETIVAAVNHRAELLQLLKRVESYFTDPRFPSDETFQALIADVRRTTAGEGVAA